jgi:glucan-binding YG repeat protein
MVPWLDYSAGSDHWERDNTGWWYEYADGSYAIGWTMIDGSWYYFNQSGYMLTGWLYDHNYQAWYYFDPNSGKMQTGWLYLEGYCYYLNFDGQMLTGWQMIDGNWFYLNTTDKWPAGAMFTGFHEIDGKMYYFNERSDGTRGAMLKGWVEVNGNWYYFDGSGAMLYGWQQINGNWYHLDEGSGIMSVNAWFYKDGVWQYVNANGAVTEGAQWSGVFENGLDIGTGFYATIDIPLTGTRVGADSNPDSATYQNVEVQAVREKTAADYNEQLWYFERRDDDGSYRITNAATGMCLDQLGGYVDMGTNVRVCPNYESLAQRWFVFVNGDHYGFVSACSAWDMTVLDVVDGRGDEGTNIRIWSNNGTGAQQFVVNRIPETTVTSKSFSLSFEDEILVNLYYTVSDLSDVIEHGMLTFYTNPDTVDIANADAVYSEPVYDSAKDRYMATTDGIPAKQMGDTRYYVAYAKLSDGSYVYSKVYDYSPKKYAMNMLGKASTSEKQKALCVAMLNYGASVQQYFGYNTDNLMNADLTDAQKALVVAYDKTLFTGSVRADSGKIGGFAATNGFSKKTATVSFDSAFAINYYFTPNAAMDSELAFYYWTAQDYNAAATLTAGNASGELVMEDNGNGVYWAQVTGIAAKQLDDTYYVAGIYTDAGGNTCSTGVVAYSLSKYCMGKAVDGNEMQQLAAATAMYGYYAKLYFTA